jgi:hypothetical protein
VLVVHRRQIWLVGETVAELAPAADWLRQHARCEQRGIPSAIVFLQSRPRELSQDRIEALHSRAPLARLIVLAGPWCEGELRSGRPAHGVTRILWHQWRERLPRELEVATLPRTTSDVESLLRALPRRGAIDIRGCVAICTWRRETFAALADVCGLLGLSSVWQQPDAPRVAGSTTAAIIDGWESIEARSRICSEKLPTFLLLNWPRQEDLNRAAEQGIARVLGQPLQLADLVAALCNVIAQQPFVARPAAIA